MDRPRCRTVQAFAFALSLFVLPALSCSGKWARPPVHPAPAGAARNVILFIGDGMGFAQVEAAGMFATGRPGTLSFETFPFRGSVRTGNAVGEVTDSAAAATAMATGVKVGNGVISMALPGNGAPLETALERFKASGKSTGLVTTTIITHATPAAFGAHEPSRNNYSGIADDYLNDSRPNVLLGGEDTRRQERPLLPGTPSWWIATGCRHWKESPKSLFPASLDTAICPTSPTVSADCRTYRK